MIVGYSGQSAAIELDEAAPVPPVVCRSSDMERVEVAASEESAGGGALIAKSPSNCTGSVCDPRLAGSPRNGSARAMIVSVLFKKILEGFLAERA